MSDSFEKWWQEEGDGAPVLSRKELCKFAFAAGQEAEREAIIDMLDEPHMTEWIECVQDDMCYRNIIERAIRKRG